MNPRCVVCGDARGTRWMCATCRVDPANDGWSEGRELPRYVQPGDDTRYAFERPARDFTETERAVARGIAAGLGDAEIANELGITRERVGQVRRRRFT